ncbi:peptide deformylase [Aquimarina agarivorans]|uniref:peptide deformylase n=1 Tax=Aquimarina agarivorans TaxID=980584 RepID=UPI000248FCC6|nr:peptide deformylase [Aquimarina agarivorans]
MAILKVIKLGHPTLRSKSGIISKNEINSFEFQDFIDDLIHTMRSQNGAGIAAPQVACLKRIFIMEMQNNPRYPNKESFLLNVVINPEIEYLDNELVDSWEGCLSIPTLRGRLKRHKNILLKGLDRKGVPFEKKMTGFAAIVAQHEMDHLDGTLFIDKMNSMETLTFQKEYEKYWM